MKLALFLATLLPASALALDDAKPTAFTFRVRRATATVRVHMDGKPVAQRLVISFSDPHLPEQVIRCDDADKPIQLFAAEEDSGFSSADYNGDGYTDFRFVDLSGRPADYTGCYFFYSPSKHRFERRHDFDAAGVLDYDPRTRLFSTSGREGAVFYRFEHGHYRLIRTLQKGYADSFRDILPHVPDYREYLITTLYLSNGRVRRFYRYMGPD